MRIIRTSEDIFNIRIRFCTTRNNNVYFIHVRFFTSTIHSGNNQRTVFVIICLVYNRIATEALCVTAAEYLTDFTTLRFD